MTRLERINKRRSLAAIAIVAVALTGGCNFFRSADDADGKSAPIRASTTQQTQTYSSAQQVPSILQPGNRPVVQDQLPLIYLVESNGNCRVTNVETGEEIVIFPVKESQIVRVESKGVLLANKQVIGAQLAAGTYAIEILPPGDALMGVVRSQQTVTRAVPTTKPATQPAEPNSVPAPAGNPIDSPPAMPSSPATDLPPPK